MIHPWSHKQAYPLDVQCKNRILLSLLRTLFLFITKKKQVNYAVLQIYKKIIGTIELCMYQSSLLLLCCLQMAKYTLRYAKTEHQR